MSWLQEYWSSLLIVGIGVSLVILILSTVKSSDEVAKEAALNAKCYWNPAGVCLCVYKDYSIGFMAYAPDRACPSTEEEEQSRDEF